MPNNNSLTVALARNNSFNKSLKELPDELRKQVMSVDFLKEHWDGLDPKARLTFAVLHDNSEYVESQRRWQNSLKSVKDITEEIDQKKSIAASSFSDNLLKEEHLAGLRAALANLKQEQQSWLARGDYDLEKIQADGTETKISTNTCKAVSADEIIDGFILDVDDERNSKWWKDRFSDAKRYGLVECRVGEGKKGPAGTLWRPDLIAGWLVDRKSNGKVGLSNSAARNALKKFPGCDEIAEDKFPAEEQGEM